MWAGSHHLHYTALPHWVQTLGMTFSVMLLVPSWASAGNALLTLNGAWHKVRDDATLRFMMVAAVFYGLSTFEGSFMAIRPVNSLSHYTDWTVGHVHAGALGWVAMITFGSLYTLVPTCGSASACIRRRWSRSTSGSRSPAPHLRLRDVELRHHPGADVADLQRGRHARLFLRRYLVAMHPYYIARAFGGLLFLIGAVVCCYNVWMTIRAGRRKRQRTDRQRRRPRAVAGGVRTMPNFHRKLERSAIGFVLAIIGAASVGGIVEIAPLFTIDETVEEAPDMRVYTPLELAGRNIYVREGCYACHSQMIRTLRDEVERYGPYSLAVESKYDHPMLWGSKRTGPDLARIGGKYSDAWHVAHLINPRDVVPESVMPPTAGWRAMRSTSTTGGNHLAAQRASACPIPTR
jgi:cytochrome c oxidase cbb3-type subunit I/II